MKKFIITIATMAMLLGSAHAADWNFYGSARMSTYYESVEVSGTDTTQFSMGLQDNSRIGAAVNVSDTLSGRFEYGASNGNANIRYLYGVWNFGVGSLMVGQHEGPLRHPGSDQVYATDAGLGGWGEMSSPRKAQLKLMIDTFRLALRAHSPDYNDGTNNVTTDTEVKIPSIEAKYRFVGDNYNLGISAGYGHFKVGTSNQEGISSYVLGIGGDLTLGGFILGANLFGGENVGNLVDADVNGEDTGMGLAQYDGTRVIDNKALAWKIHATYVFNDMFGIQAGYGYMRTELDNQAKDEVQSYYVQVPITLATGVSIVPEIGTLDYREAGQSRIDYLGAKWQIDF